MQEAGTIANFKTSLRGHATEPKDRGYDEARALYNGMIDKRPRMIARCADVADVINAVSFGRQRSAHRHSRRGQCLVRTG